MSKYYSKEITIESEDKRIYGIAYIPQGKRKFPLVIFGHGVGGAYSDNLEYAKLFARMGIAAYSFDFCGGGGRMSSGKTTNMSVLTEVEDMSIVLKDSRNWSFVDPEKIVLLGISQGGIVAAITAAEHRNDVAGLILEFPAFVIPEAVHNLFSSREEIPETYDLFGWLKIGKRYALDMWDYDVYGEIKKYDKKVLLLHGDNDPVVPLENSIRASKVYKNVDFHVIPGAGHGFFGEAFRKAFSYIYSYLREIGILK